MRKQRLQTLLGTALLCSAGLLALPAAGSPIVEYDFTVDIDSGPLSGAAGDPFSGSFSFDEALSFPIPLSSFDFGFVDGSGGSFSYGLGDANTPPTAEQDILSSGTFVGINYLFSDANLSFTFAPGFFNLSDATFGYEFQDSPGTGELTITEAGPESVPVPATPLLVLLGAAGLLVSRRRMRPGAACAAP